MKIDFNAEMDTSIKQDLYNISDYNNRSNEIIDAFSNPQKYTPQEFEKLRGDIPGAMYLLEYKPEILEHKDLFEAIRKTKKVKQIILEDVWSQWYVVQISDICVKFKNKDSQTNFRKELSNYKLIEDLHMQLGPNDLYSIPILERYLCNDRRIVMEYIPWFSITTNFVLKDKGMSPNDIYNTIYKSQYDYDDLSHIKERLDKMDVNEKNILNYIKEHELKTVLHYLWIEEVEFENVSWLDTLFLIEYCLGKESPDYLQIYKKRKQILKNNHILSLDDHGGNIKLYNNRLYGLDFWNINFTTRLKK